MSEEDKMRRAVSVLCSSVDLSPDSSPGSRSSDGSSRQPSLADGNASPKTTRGQTRHASWSRARTSPNGLQLDRPAWQAEEGRGLRPDIHEPCKNATEEQSARLPRNESELRRKRHRQPKGQFDLDFRRGASLSEVCDKAALRVVERWIRILDNHVPREDLPWVIALLVHGEEGEAVVSRSEPVGAALGRVVPRPGEASVFGWTFLDDMREALSMEEKLNRACHVFAKPPDEALKLAIICGRDLPIWERPKMCSSTFSRSAWLVQSPLDPTVKAPRKRCMTAGSTSASQS